MQTAHGRIRSEFLKLVQQDQGAISLRVVPTEHEGARRRAKVISAALPGKVVIFRQVGPRDPQVARTTCLHESPQ